MRKGLGAGVFSVLLVALTIGVAIWDLQATRLGQVQAAAVRPTPSPPPVAVISPRHSPADFQAGVSVVIYGNDPYFQPKTRTLLDRLARLGVNSVSLVIPIFQNGPPASAVYPDPIRTPTDARVAVFATEAHRRGFTVMLRPLLDILVQETPNDWRGTIHPQDLAGWQQSYAGLIEHYAMLARANRLEALDIGSELDSMERDTAYWLRLIASVRRAYPGLVTYSSNWPKAFPVFGRALDFISVDAYFPLNASTDAPVAQLAAAWNPWLNRLNAMRRAFAKPLVLTELGTTSQAGSYQRPWVGENGQPLDLSAQQRYYQAACQAVVPAVGGVYWWLYTLDPPAHPAVDRGFTVEAKPAESDLSRCFGGGSVPPAGHPGG